MPGRLRRAICVAAAGLLHNVIMGGVSLFWLFIVVGDFFSDGGFAIVGPYAAEVWPSRLRTTGMGSAYGFGGIGKIIGPLGLALIVGSSNVVKPDVTVAAIPASFLFLAAWLVVCGLGFALFGFETRQRSIAALDEGYAGSGGPGRSAGDVRSTTVMDAQVSEDTDFIARIRALAPEIAGASDEIEATPRAAALAAGQAARRPVLPHAAAALDRRRGAAAGVVRDGDRGDRRGGCLHRLVRMPEQRLLDVGGVSGAGGGARDLRPVHRHPRLGSAGRAVRGATGRGRLSHQRQVALRQRQPPCDMARRAHARGGDRPRGRQSAHHAIPQVAA